MANYQRVGKGGDKNMTNEQELGKEGEQQARIFLKNQGFEIQSPDWLGYKNGEWVCFEIKKKERFTAGGGCDFDGHGLDEKQIYLRKRLQEKTGIRTMLIIFEIPTNKIFFRYLDLLEAGEKHRTKNGIVIYPLKNFLIK